MNLHLIHGGAESAWYISYPGSGKNFIYGKSHLASSVRLRDPARSNCGKLAYYHKVQKLKLLDGVNEPLGYISPDLLFIVFLVGRDK